MFIDKDKWSVIKNDDELDLKNDFISNKIKYNYKKWKISDDLYHKILSFVLKLNSNKIKINEFYIKNNNDDRSKKITKLLLKLNKNFDSSYEEVMFCLKNKRFFVIFLFERGKKIKTVAKVFKLENIPLTTDYDFNTIEKRLIKNIELNNNKKSLVKFRNTINRVHFKPVDVLNHLNNHIEHEVKFNEKLKNLKKLKNSVNTFFKENKIKINDFYLSESSYSPYIKIIWSHKNHLFHFKFSVSYVETFSIKVFKLNTSTLKYDTIDEKISDKMVSSSFIKSYLQT